MAYGELPNDVAFTARNTAVNVFTSTTPRTRIRAAPTNDLNLGRYRPFDTAVLNGDPGTAASTTTGAKLATAT
jgi:hypothetical protein